ncbi:MAG: hypothetical protein JEZ14_26740, partial [Marinilabiliaceae bacterium]|nr:hypothetical protein [Marinilabiliaceae bacterium]
MKQLTLALLTVLLFSCNAKNNSNSLDKLSVQITTNVQYYNGSKVEDVSEFIFDKGRSSLENENATWQCIEKKYVTDNCSDFSYAFQLTKGSASAAGVAINFEFNDWSTDNYIVMPAAVYNGNRFEVLKYSYPPLFLKEDYTVDRPVTITDVPRLNKYEGESHLDLNTGDLTTPAVGVYFPKTKKGIWIVTEQATELGNSVLTLNENEDRTKADFTISAPCVREKIYGMTRLSDSNETGVDWKQGDKVTIRCKVFAFENLNSPAELNNQFLSIRKSFGTVAHVDQLPFSKAFELMEDQQNQECWDETNGFYSLGGEGWNHKWQLGWVGGCMVTHPLSLIGQGVSQERSFQNYDKIITQSQAKSGFYYSCGNGKSWCSDCFSEPFNDNLLLLRKNADALYFFYKYCLSQETIHPDWQRPEAWKQPLD